MSYLDALREIVPKPPPPASIVLGDFNQPVISGHGVPQAARAALANLFEAPLEVASAGPPDRAIDHCFALSGLRIVGFELLERHRDGGLTVSDHHGLVVRLVALN